MTSPETKAININSLNGVSFPVSIEFNKTQDFFRIYLTPISILEIIDLIPQNSFLIFNVDANEYENLNSLTLKQLINKYSSYTKIFDEETILLNKENLIRLLNEISHYNFCLIDAQPEIELNEVIQIIDLADKWNEIIVIKETSANVFLSSHDDCYMYFETASGNLAFEIIGRQIKTLVTTVTDCPINKLIFDSKDIITQNNFSIVIPQNPVQINEFTIWKILEGTFKDFVYSKQMNESEFSLVYNRANNHIKLKKSEAERASD